MIKKRLFFLLFFFIYGCGDFKFVYDKEFKEIHRISDKTYIAVSGDSSESIYSYLVSRIGNKETEYEYKLSVYSSKIKEASVIDKDATASKFRIKFIIDYSLVNKLQNCAVTNKSFETTSFFDAKSDGYSFGTDFSETTSSTNNIESNINEFISFLVLSDINFDCINEN
tara:strand:- start:541 stop:1047 length:507 start_codon:yes stop_codon:yes gene_type:complete